MVAGVVALVASGVGAFAVAGGALAATAGSVATYAGLAAGVAGLAGQITAKKPAARGSVNQLLIGSNLPMPYLMGESYSPGVQVHDVGYGGKVGKVTNPYRFLATVHSCCGPVDGIVQPLADFAPPGSYYAGWIEVDSQLGARPEPDELKSGFAGNPPDWGPAHKLSGFAGIGWGLKFDKDAKRFSGGVPALGAVWRGVWAYDPRLDSTFPGGAGPQRIDDEATWTYTRCPALHAGAYAYGRHVNGVRVFGVDLGADGVDFTAVAAWANLCDANGWTVNGIVYEPGDKWNNLKRIAECGSGEPLFAGGVLTFRWDAPRAVLDLITLDDLADGEPGAPAMRPWKERLNTVIPKYRSAAHRWDYVAADAIVDPAALAEDGEEKSEERQFDLVTGKDQAAALAAYAIANGREAGPIVLPCKTRMIEYRPGDRLQLSDDLAAELAVDEVRCVVTQRGVDPASGIVSLTLRTDREDKHAWALGRSGIVPPAPTVTSAQDRDDAAFDNSAAPDLTDLTATLDAATALIADQQSTLDSYGRRLRTLEEPAP